MINEKFIIVGSILGLVGGLSYLIDVLKGKVQPNRVTWFLWTAAPLLAFSAEIHKGVGLQSLMTFSAGLNPLLVFIASFFNRKAYWKLKKSDYVFGGLALTGLILWKITGEGNLAIAFSILADGMAAIPTVVKSWKYPNTESGLIYGLSSVNALITLLTVKNWNFETYGFPIYFLSICATLFILVKFKLGRVIKPNEN
jgi:hypothetical protein